MELLDNITTAIDEPEAGKIDIGAIMRAYAMLPNSAKDPEDIFKAVDDQEEEERDVDIQVIEPLKITHDRQKGRTEAQEEIGQGSENEDR